jgi:hypothetical protein
LRLLDCVIKIVVPYAVQDSLSYVPVQTKQFRNTLTAPLVASNENDAALPPWNIKTPPESKKNVYRITLTGFSDSPSTPLRAMRNCTTELKVLGHDSDVVATYVLNIVDWATLFLRQDRNALHKRASSFTVVLETCRTGWQP